MVRAAVRVLALWSMGLSAFGQSTIAGRKVSVVVVNPDDLTLVKWEGTGPAVTSAHVTTTTDDTIDSLLQSNGIYPDSEAFTLIYDLNPALKNLSLGDGASLEIPRVANEDELSKLKASGYLARVSVDPELRGSLSQSIGELENLVNRSAGLTSPTVQSQLTRIATSYAQIDETYRRRRGPPLRRETLQQLADEVTALNAILKTLVGTKKPLSGDDQAQIAAINEDLAQFMTHYDERMGGKSLMAEDSCAVIVNINGAKSTQRDTLRVYYTFNGLYREPPSDPPVRSSEWTQLGSGHSEKLLNDKNYRLWAASDGDPGHPLTAPFRLETTCGSDETPVDLSVITKVH
jgi:hypothetical protein